MAYRKLTQAEFETEATERFGGPMRWAFRCPRCEDVATPRDFEQAGGEAGRAGQECIGRTLRQQDPGAERGCDWVAYGLVPGPWEIVMPAEGDQPERTLRAFPLADAMPASSR